MEILAPVAPAVNKTRQPEFIAAIIEADISPFMLGALDAEKNEICCPEMYFAWDGAIMEYVEGYKSVAGDNATTKQITAKSGKGLLTDAEILAELEDLTEDMLDRMFHASGAW